jgi:hypothetical protein
MKKILMIAVMAVAALNANAQAWVGGEIGFTSSHTNGVGTEKLFTVKPEVGYSLNEKFDVAIALGYSYASEKTHKNLGREKFSVNSFEINPYVRYKFIKVGGFFAFVDGGIGYATTHFKGVSNNVNTIGVNITPGIAYAISPKVTLVSHLGEGLYYNHEWQKSGEYEGMGYGYHANNVGFRLFNGITFGAYVNL